MKNNYLFFAFFLWPLILPAQIEISGTITDAETQTPVGSASAVISPKGQTNILGYDISDSEGKFRVKLKPATDSITLKVSSLGYTTYEKRIPATSQELIITLATATESLEEVFLKKPPIRQRGDTLIFDPEAFKSNKDRSILDVLAKMPGIEVDAGGEIKYQGEPINKFYVEGLDLMGGQYGMMSNNLNADKVSSVEILENHQPLKVLDSLIPTNRAAINIRLKKEVTISGNVEAGGGVAPGLWFGKLSPMFFTKNFQTLISYQTNNTGNDVTNDFSVFAISGFRFGYRSDTRKEWVSLATVSPPPFAGKRWLDNQAHAASVNTLIKDKNNYEFKINASYLNNLIRHNGGNQTTYLLPEGDLIIDNKTQNQSRDESLDASLSIERNKDKNFMKEKLSFAGKWDRASAFLTENDQASNQYLKTPYKDLKNDFELIFPWGKELLTFNSNIGYNESPQELVIRPGVFTDLLSPGSEPEEISQYIFHKRFLANHSLDFTKKWRSFSMSFRPGIDFVSENMHAEIFTDKELYPDDTFQNHMKWQQFSTYTEVSAYFKSDNFNASLNLPFRWNSYRIENRLKETSQTENPFTLNPNFWTEYKFSGYWKATANAGYNKSYGPLNQMYNGYLLKNYRNLSRNNIPLMKVAAHNFSLGLEYRNPISSWFGRIYYTYSERKQYQIFNTTTQPNGATVTEALDQLNKTGSNSVSASVSRLIAPLRTTFKISTAYSHSGADMLFNGALFKNTNSRWVSSLNLSGDFTDWMTAEYNASLHTGTTRNKLQNNRKIQTKNHKIGLYFYFLENHTVNFSGEYLKSELGGDSQADFFGDFMYRFTLSDQKKIDFELSVINIFNKDTYKNLSVGDYTYSESYYVLRPRQFLVKIRFPL